MPGAIIGPLIAFAQGDRRLVNHTLKVTGYALAIAAGEQVSDDDRRILAAAAVLHDIGIPLAMAKYGHADGPAQEELGPPQAHKMLAALAWSDADIQRVQELVGHHHSYDYEGGLLLQILFEADWIVNLDEGRYPDHTPDAICTRYFRTPTGIALFHHLFPAAR